MKSIQLIENDRGEYKIVLKRSWLPNLYYWCFDDKWKMLPSPWYTSISEDRKIRNYETAIKHYTEPKNKKSKNGRVIKEFVIEDNYVH